MPSVNERQSPLTDRLRLSDGPGREFIWSMASSEERAIFWSQVRGEERFSLLPPSEQARRSPCCSASKTVQSIILHDGNVYERIGTVNMCAKCARIIGAAAVTPGIAGWSQKSFNLLVAAPTEYKRLNCKRNAAGDIVPLGHEERIMQKPDVAALAAGASRDLSEAQDFD